MLKHGLLALLLAAFTLPASADDPPPDHPSPVGLVLWLDATDAKSITADADGHVQQWMDHSGNGYAVIAPDKALLQPQLIKESINRRPALHFSGQQFLSGIKALRDSPGPISVFVVARTSGAKDATRGQPLLDIYPDAKGLVPSQQTFSLTTATDTGKPNETTIFYGEAASVPIGPFELGMDLGDSYSYFTGDIAEVLIYNRPFLSAGERQLVTDYLRAKWKASVPLAPGEWTRVGDLGKTPEHAHQDLPLSDQDNKGNWTLDPKFSDDFKESALDMQRWIPAPEAVHDPGWRGRQPALFLRTNTTINNGMLEITDRKGDVPEMAQYPGQGYSGYTSGFIDTQDRSGYGYYEIKARPHNSAFCSAFWLHNTGIPDTGTEIDIFEIGAKAHGFEHIDNMTAHVWGTPQDKRHWAVGGRWEAPWKLGDDFHVYGFEWNKDELRWYVDGVLVHKLKNTNWFYPMRITFDSEPMLKWFGPINDADLPSTFDVQYLRVWRQQTP